MGCADFFEDAVEFGIFVAADEGALKKAVLEGGPGLNGHIVQAAVIEGAAVGAAGCAGGEVYVDAGGDQGAVGDGKL